jgi:hypothetical protein
MKKVLGYAFKLPGESLTAALGGYDLLKGLSPTVGQTKKEIAEFKADYPSEAKKKATILKVTVESVDE